MKASSVQEYIAQQSAAQAAKRHMAILRKRVAVSIETQLEVKCAEHPEDAYGDHFVLNDRLFRLRAIPWMPGGIEVTDISGQKALFYWDILQGQVAVEFK